MHPFGYVARSRVFTVAAIVALALAGVAGPAAAVEPGDEPGTAITVGTGVSRYDSTSMTESGADPADCAPDFAGPFSNTMWFSYTAERTALTVVDVNSFVSVDGSTDFLAIVFVYASSQLVGCSAFPATVMFGAEAGTTYTILVAGLPTGECCPPELSDRGGTFDLSITAIRGRVLIDKFTNSATFLDEGLSEACGFDVSVSFNAKIIVKTFFSATEARAFTATVVGSTTFTAADGTTVLIRYAQIFRDTLDGKIAFIGLDIRASVNGHPVVFDAGKIVLGPDGQVTFEGGPHPVFYNGFDLCAALGG